MNLNYENEIKRFNILHEAVIDASSLIYLGKAGFLEQLCSTVNLFTLYQIREETGFTFPNIQVVASPAGGTSNDQALLDFAISKNLPLISEDKKLLTKSAKKGHPYYNSLMMLVFLFYKQKIAANEFFSFKKKLLSVARYSEKVIEYGSALFDYLSKR